MPLPSVEWVKCGRDIKWVKYSRYDGVNNWALSLLIMLASLLMYME